MARAYFDRHGHYEGFSVGACCPLAGLGCLAIAGFCAMVIPWAWPLVYVHGLWQWPAEIGWLAFLLAVFLLLGRRAHNKAARRGGPH